MIDRASYRRRHEKAFVDVVGRVVNDNEVEEVKMLKGKDFSYADYVKYLRTKCLPDNQVPEKLINMLNALSETIIVDYCVVKVKKGE